MTAKGQRALELMNHLALNNNAPDLPTSVPQPLQVQPPQRDCLRLSGLRKTGRGSLHSGQNVGLRLKAHFLGSVIRTPGVPPSYIRMPCLCNVSNMAALLAGFISFPLSNVRSVATPIGSNSANSSALHPTNARAAFT